MELELVNKPFKVFETIDISKTSLDFQIFIENYLNYIIPHNYELKNILNAPFTFLRRTIVLKTHIGLCYNHKMNFLESMTHMNRRDIEINYDSESLERNKIWIASELEPEKFPERVPFLHLTINTNEQMPLYHQQLRFFFQLSGTFFFHLKYEAIESINLGGYNILQSLFINAIQYSKNIAFLKTELIIIVHDSNFEESRLECSNRIKKMIQKIWKESLSYLKITEKELNFKLNDLFLIWDIFRFGSKKYNLENFEKRIQGIKTFLKDVQILGLEIDVETIEKMEFRKLINIKNYKSSIANAWLRGRHINYISMNKELIPLSFFPKAFCSNLLIEIVFDLFIFLDITKKIKNCYLLT
jgi:hypothetical protein